MDNNNHKSIIKPKERYIEISSGDMTRIAGISKETTNSQNIHLAIATIPPGKSSSAHFHVNCESAIYVLSGNGIFIAGEKLDKHNKINEGDFIYVPPNAPHKPVNTNNDAPLILIVSRNQPTEIVKEIPDEKELNKIKNPVDCSIINLITENKSNSSTKKTDGVTSINADTKNISMTKLIIEPSKTTSAHNHANYESAIFVVKGKGLFISNERLDSHQNIEKNDFIYISKNLSHKISNTDSINQLEIIIARNIRI